MFKIEKIDENSLNLELNGKLDRDEMQSSLDEFEEKAKDIKEGTILYDVIDFDFMTMTKTFVEIAKDPRMFKLMKNFKKVAVLTDKFWLKNLAMLESAIYPGVNVKAFNRSQKAHAIEWLENIS